METASARSFEMELPSTTQENWYFHFRCTFELSPRPQHIVVHYQEHTIGSGSFSIRDCSVPWLQHYKAFVECAKLAMQKAFLWNTIDAEA